MSAFGVRAGYFERGVRRNPKMLVGYLADQLAPADKLIAVFSFVIPPEEQRSLESKQSSSIFRVKAKALLPRDSVGDCLKSAFEDLPDATDRISQT